MTTAHLSTYLRDHHAAAIGGLELARRTLRSNRGTEFEPTLVKLVREIDEDRETLAAIMESLGVHRDALKVGAVWTAEKLGRLKLNGRVLGYSPLSRLVELELLVAGITAKQGLWRSLRTAAAAEPSLDGRSLRGLEARAGRQIDEVEAARLRAAEIALGD